MKNNLTILLLILLNLSFAISSPAAAADDIKKSINLTFMPIAPAADGIQIVQRTDQKVVFKQMVKHSSLKIKTPSVTDVNKHNILTFKVKAPQNGRMTFFYLDADGVMISVNDQQTIKAGEYEYCLDLNKVVCGKGYRQREIEGFEKFGGKARKISGIRFDFWFPVNTELEFKNVKLGTFSVNNIDGNNVTNYVLNGSFESVNLSGIPDGWGAGTWGLRGINAQYPEQWRQSFQVSDQYAFNGKKSVMLTPQTAIPHPQLWSCWQIIPSAAAQVSSWNLSGYVYSKQNGKIKLALLEAGASDFEVLTEQEFSFSAGKWQRFAIKSHNLPQRVIIRFTADCSEAVYVDAIQLEADKISEFVPGINDKKYLFPTAGAAPGVFQPDKLLTLPSDQITELTCKDGVFRQNGRAFIPFAFGAQTTQLDANMVKRVRENGFNAINLYIQKSKDVESLKIAKVGGLYTIPWMRPATEADFPNLIKAIGNDSGVIAIMAIDEPPNPLSPHVLKRFRTSRQLLPSKPVMINYRTAEINTFKSRMKDLPGDIISCDQYPLGNFIFPGTVHDCAELIKKMSGELIPAKRGVWNYFQLSGNAFMNFREPSPAEFEYMIYSSLLAGCRGFITFHNQPLSNDLWLTAGRVSREISALSPVVIDGKNLDKLPPMPPEILIAGWRWENYNYYILVNTSEKNISYDWNISDSQLCFESDSNINKFSLNPLRRRVYRCKVSN